MLTACNDEAKSSNIEKTKAIIDHEKTDREVAAALSMLCTSRSPMPELPVIAPTRVARAGPACLILAAPTVAANVASELAESDATAVAALAPVAPTATIKAIATTLFPTISTPLSPNLESRPRFQGAQHLPTLLSVVRRTGFNDYWSVNGAALPYD